MNRFDHESWEEEAFAEDGRRGPLGGFIWPPRSYSCSFCTREFRSAQALGGHMNIHRRERAKLKQSLNSSSTIPPQNPNYHLSYPPNPSTLSSPSSSRVSLLRCSNSDTNKSSSCDQVQMLLPSAVVETNFILGFHLDSPPSKKDSKTNDDHRGFDDEEVMNFKRQKTIVMPLMIMGSIEEVDLELRDEFKYKNHFFSVNVRTNLSDTSRSTKRN